MGTGPVPAVRKCLNKAGWDVSDLDLVEANEAFAAQAICVVKELGRLQADAGAGAGDEQALLAIVHAVTSLSGAVVRWTW